MNVDVSLSRSGLRVAGIGATRWARGVGAQLVVVLRAFAYDTRWGTGIRWITSETGGREDIGVE